MMRRHGKSDTDAIALTTSQGVIRFPRNFALVAIFFQTCLYNIFIAATETQSASNSDTARVTYFYYTTYEVEINNTYGLENSKALKINNIKMEPVKHVVPYFGPALAHISNIAIEY